MVLSAPWSRKGLSFSTFQSCQCTLTMLKSAMRLSSCSEPIAKPARQLPPRYAAFFDSHVRAFSITHIPGMQVDILEPGTINRVEIQEQEVEGQIFRAGKMVRASDNRRSSTYNDRDESGSIAYVKAPTDSEESERKLRVTYMAADVANSEELREGDKVTFQLAIDRLTRKQRAVNIKVVEKAVFPTVDGIIASLKDAFGFIARADCDDEVFFHFSEFLADEHPAVGDEVRHVAFCGANCGSSERVDRYASSCKNEAIARLQSEY